MVETVGVKSVVSTIFLKGSASIKEKHLQVSGKFVANIVSCRAVNSFLCMLNLKLSK